MARRISSGVLGRALLGQLLSDTNTIKTLSPNADLILTPDGTGEVKSDADLQLNSNSNLKFADADSSNYVELAAPATIGANITYTLPATGVTDGYVIATDASGNLSWVSPALDITNDVGTTNECYPTFLTTSTGETTEVRTSAARLKYFPNTGVFRASTLESTGEVIAYFSSDERLKENVTNIADPIEKVQQLNGVEYDWTEDYINQKGGEDGYFVRKHDVGLIAQDVEKVLPEIVAENEDGFKAIKYDRVVALLVEVVKEQQKEIDILKDTINGSNN